MMDTDLPDANTLCQQLLERKLTLEELPSPLADDLAKPLVDCLKAEANRYWSIDPNVSLRLADLIIQIGRARRDTWQTALGTMARGDALKFLGHLQAAWDHLEKAAELFKSIDDEVGWARTRIGPLVICINLGQTTKTLADAEEARKILIQHGEIELLLNLEMNLGLAYLSLRDCQQALTCFNSALQTAESLDREDTYLCRLLLNIGLTHFVLGDLPTASEVLNRARAISIARHESYWLTHIELNLAGILRNQGHYKDALRLLDETQQRIEDRFPELVILVKEAIASCYLFLNRYKDARNLAQEVARQYEKQGNDLARAVVYINLATAEAELGNFEDAWIALDAAETIFTDLKANAWLVTVWLWRATIALKTGDTETAYCEAQRAAYQFANDNQQVGYANALLRQGQALSILGNSVAARIAAQSALRIAQHSNLAWSRYSAHLLLGQLAEAQDEIAHAFRHYRAAMATVERVQRGLTITLRPDFLEDKNDAPRALIRLYLRAGQLECAFETLERIKSQVFLSYLNDQESLHWVTDDPFTRPLLNELERLRDEHRWFYYLAKADTAQDQTSTSNITPEQARHEVAWREKRMRAVTEQLYLYNREKGLNGYSSLPSCADIQTHIPDDTVLIEFYNDGKHLWAFTLDRYCLDVYSLPMTVSEVDHYREKLRSNVDYALTTADPFSPTMSALTQYGQRFAQQLYCGLLEPLTPRLRHQQRLIIVPYGSLHYLPFHLLHTGQQYLIERHEIVILPAAGLIGHPPPQRTGGVRVLAHSRNGNLPQTLAEARLVQSMLGGEVYVEQQTQRTVLRTSPCQVLHIAAHGEFRIDLPDLSYIELADGQLYTDDLLQYDLSYELITLSACETGRAALAAGDELIGLGRGCLYAGAGALLVSLWQVEDGSTLRLMEFVYQALCAGLSKAAALREAQRAMLATQPKLHHAFWGAFQLIGNANPLSVY